MTRSHLLLVLLTVLTACSPTPPLVPPAPLPSGGVDLYLSRSHMNGTEFEYYHVEGDTLLVECGNILGGRQNSLSREVMDLDEDDLDSLAASLTAVREKAFSQLEKFNKPGTSIGLADPGEFRFSYEDESGSHRINTSLDSITRSIHERERELKTLAESLRSLAEGNTCGNKSFYGLQRHDS